MEDFEKLLEQELLTLQKKMKDYLSTQVPILDYVLRYIIKQKGKFLRPYFVFLSGKLFGDITESTYRAAAAVELLHTATLIHDDVVDMSEKRRGFFSIKAIWKNKIAVLSGDYLLSKGMLLLLDNKDYEQLQLLSEAVKKMSEAELLQLEKAKFFGVNEKNYFKIIEGKTASLIASSCAIGTASVCQDKEKIQLMEKVGNLVGIAFQIKDDLLDLSLQDIGKPRGQDLKDNKMTLPILYTLEQLSWLKKRQMKYWINNSSKNPKQLEKVLRTCKEEGGIEYAEKKMNTYVQEAKGLLNTLPDSQYRKAFHSLIDFTISRKK